MTDPEHTQSAEKGSIPEERRAFRGSLRVLLALALFARSASAATGTATTALAEAKDALDAGDADRARRSLEQPTPPLGDLRALLRARALVALGKKDRAYRELDPIKRPNVRCGKVEAPRQDFVGWSGRPER